MAKSLSGLLCSQLVRQLATFLLLFTSLIQFYLQPLFRIFSALFNQVYCYINYASLQYSHKALTAIGGHFDQVGLLDFPDRFVDLLFLVGEVRQIGNGAARCDKMIARILVPQILLNQVTNEMRIYNLKTACFNCENKRSEPNRKYAHLKFALGDASRVEIRCERLERLVVAQNLRRRGGRHWREKKRVSDAEFSDARLERRPIPHVARHNVPHIVLQDATRDRRARVRFVRSVALGDFARRLERSIVDRLEDLLVELARLLACKRQTHHLEGVSKTLHA